MYFLNISQVEETEITENKSTKQPSIQNLSLDKKNVPFPYQKPYGQESEPLLISVLELILVSVQLFGCQYRLLITSQKV